MSDNPERYPLRKPLSQFAPVRKLSPLPDDGHAHRRWASCIHPRHQRRARPRPHHSHRESKRDREVEEPAGDDLFEVGTACNILQDEEKPRRFHPDARAGVLLACASNAYYGSDGLIEAEVSPFEVEQGNDVTLEAAFRELKEKFADMIESSSRNIQPEVAQFVMNSGGRRPVCRLRGLSSGFSARGQTGVCWSPPDGRRARPQSAGLDRHRNRTRRDPAPGPA